MLPKSASIQWNINLRLGLSPVEFYSLFVLSTHLTTSLWEYKTIFFLKNIMKLKVYDTNFCSLFQKENIFQATMG